MPFYIMIAKEAFQVRSEKKEATLDMRFEKWVKYEFWEVVKCPQAGIFLDSPEV